MPSTVLIDNRLAPLRETLLFMASLADCNLNLAMEALVQRDTTLADRVEAADCEIDQLEIDVDELVLKHMALRAPKATESRFMLVATKISANLERVGDQAVSIARRARELSSEPESKPLIDISPMSDLALGMLRDSIASLVDRNPSAAREIIKRDKEVDRINREIERKLTEFMIADSTAVPRCLKMTLVARCVERIADHAKNISEDVVYLFEGEDIRHGQKSLRSEL